MVGQILRLFSRFALLMAVGWHVAAPSAASAQSEATVRVRVGEHGGFDRIVFDWSSRVPYRVESKSGVATVIFERPARLDLTKYRDNPPPFFRSVKTRSEGTGTAVDIEVPQGTKLRHFLSGNSIVLDVLAPGTPKDAPAAGLRPAKPAKALTATAPKAGPPKASAAAQSTAKENAAKAKPAKATAPEAKPAD